MAMFIAHTCSNLTEQVHVQGNVHAKPMDVLVVQADGHELERCLSLLGMKSYPCREDGKPLRVVKFYGDQAKFIVGNWS